MIYSRMDNNFELVPLEAKGATGWIYLYLRSFVGWILSFFDIYEIKEWFSYGIRATIPWATTDCRHTKPGSVLNTRVSAFWSTSQRKGDFSRGSVVRVQHMKIKLIHFPIWKRSKISLWINFDDLFHRFQYYSLYNL